MKILLLGQNGQVGWELQRALLPLGEVIGLERHSVHLCGDLAQPEKLAETVRTVKPNVIVNAAAYTAVDKAESEPALARTINATSPGVLGREAAALGATLVHYSTDYVFDGSGDQPRDESASTNPLSVYGKTKLAGEQAIFSSGCSHLILRTSWVYGAHGENFAKAILRLASQRSQLSVVADQVGAPTGADLIADTTAHALRILIQRPELTGLYHCVAGGETTWHDYAIRIIGWARKNGLPIRVANDQIFPLSTADYPTVAKRPLNSRLDTRALRQAFEITLPQWQLGVDRMLTELYKTPMQ